MQAVCLKFSVSRETCLQLSDRLRTKTREMKQNARNETTYQLGQTPSYEDPAIIQVSKRTSSGKIRPQNSCNKLSIDDEKR